MVNLAAMVWRRLLRKRWVLALVFGLSLVYFLSSTFKQVRRGRDGVELGLEPAAVTLFPGSSFFLACRVPKPRWQFRGLCVVSTWVTPTYLCPPFRFPVFWEK
jgi:hypothetical protein